MRVSTRDQREIIRTEDVVFTLNNIIDDITRMYASSFDDAPLDDPPMDIDIGHLSPVENENQHLSTRPDSPTLPELPMSAKSTASSDSEDNYSLYSASLGPSPSSSGFTTPSSSPTSLTFITDKDTMDPISAHTFGLDRGISLVSSDAQTEACAILGHTPEVDTVGTGISKTDRVDIAPIQILDVPTIKMEPDSESFSWTPSLAIGSDLLAGPSSSPSLEQGGVEILYQTGTNPPVFLAAPSDPMPGIHPPHLSMVPPRLPPRPKYPRESPPHLLALRSPALQATPRLDQNEEWDTGSRMRRNYLGAVHLARQRQWARATIIYASSLAEPQDLPPCRPVDKYLEWGSYSSSSINPPRKRILGAMGRRVHIGPRILPRGEWNPERKGGAIDRWSSRDVLRRERVKANEDTEQEPRRKLKPIVPLWINTSRDYGKDSGTECDQAMDDDDGSVSPPHEADSTQGIEETQRERDTIEEDQDTMRLCVKDGKCMLAGTPIGIFNSESGPQSKSESSVVISSPVGEGPNTMRWYVKHGVRVSSQVGDPSRDSDPKLENGSAVDAQKTTGGERSTSIIPRNTHTVPLDQKRLDAEPYAPKKRSPLSRAFFPVSSATMKFQLRTPGDVLTVGKARRKFASMMF